MSHPMIVTEDLSLQGLRVQALFVQAPVDQARVEARL
jgi:hypothetical protein